MKSTRSPGGWIARGVLAALAAIIGSLSVTHTYAYSIHDSNAALAYQLFPWDGRIKAAAAQQLLMPEGERRASHVDALAREALRQDATSIAAATTLGVAFQLHGRRSGARRLFTYADKLSRRDLRTQLYQIEDAVGRGDINGALSHYDIALRTSRSASELLFPILTSAMADPAVRAALSRRLADNAPWAPLFIEYASSNSPHPRATAILFSELRRAGVPVSEVSRALLVDALAARGLFEQAWAYYVSLHSGVDRRRSRDASFNANLNSPTLFDWHLVPTDGLSASIEPGEPTGRLDFAAPPSVGGNLVSQMQVLPVGSYRLTGRSLGVRQPAPSLPYWSLTCRNGRELGRLTVPNSDTNNGFFAGLFDVPSGCPAQTLTLVARPSDEGRGSTGQFDRIQLEPVRVATVGN